MKVVKWFLIPFCLALSCSLVKAQEKDTVVSPSDWNHIMAINFYIIKDDFFVLPAYKVNKEWLHLEARYNYEDRNTFSAWFGYNFTGGNKFKYSITPMIGSVAGNTNGIAPGFEIAFEYFGFEFYSESEFVFDLQSKEGDFFYNWTEITYSPLDWLWFGLSGQRTRIYQTELYFQPGFEVGGGYRWFGLTGYLFNLGFDDPYGIITLSVSIPE
jgi:hypothetical protein